MNFALDAVAVVVPVLFVAALLVGLLHHERHLPETHTDLPAIHTFVIATGPAPDAMPPFIGGNSLDVANEIASRQRPSPYYHGMFSSTTTPVFYLNQT